MSYQVLARKWRPATFDALVGQEHVLRALQHALDNNRLHHAYLFTGTRGVGKTTIARILARSLNCERGISATPCGVCSACVEIAEGRSVDLIEVDAASRTKVEDTRELLENVQYVPTRLRYKIYLIDEVHMLSGHSFNALLKTLEEPPEHVKFLLATTDPQKLPATVLSRCLQFNLKNMSAERVVEHLRHVLTEEQIAFEDKALWLLGRAAAGSMRDALSLTDQAIGFGRGELLEADVAAMLGTIDRQHLLRLVSALLDDDPEALLKACALMEEQGVDFVIAVDELCSLLHRCAVAQAVPDTIDREFGDAEQIADLARRMSPEDVQLFYQLAQGGRETIGNASDPRSAFEMLALRLLAFRPVEPLDPSLNASQLTAAGYADESEVSDAGKKPEPPSAATESVERDASSPEASASAPVAAAPAQDSGEQATRPWHEILAQLAISGSARLVASHCVLLAVEGDRWSLRLEQSRTSLFSQRQVDVITRALSAWVGNDVSVDIEMGAVEGETPAAREERKRAERQASAEAAIAEDPRVKRLISEFGGAVVEGSVTVTEPTVNEWVD